MENKAMEIKFNGELYLAGRDNTLLFTHFGKLAMYDHVFLIPQEGEDGDVGGYIWNDHQAYQPVVDFIQTYNFPQRLNLTNVAECDVAAHKEAHPSGLWVPDNSIKLPKGTYTDLEDLYFTDSFPEEWDER